MDESDTGPARASSGLTTHVLVLNRHYAAVRIVSARRAFSLLFKCSAEVIDDERGQFSSFSLEGWVVYSLQAESNGHLYVRTPRYAILVPRVIRLIEYDKVPRTEVKFNRRNLFARDDHRCQYCGRKFPASSLSLDHVVPKSRGGKSAWTNVVTACNPCNTKKGGRFPSEASMKLLKHPVAPKRNPQVVENLRSGRYEIWRHFVRDRDWAIEA